MNIRELIERKKSQFREQRTANIEARKEQLKVLSKERKEREENEKLRQDIKNEKSKIRNLKTARIREFKDKVKAFKKQGLTKQNNAFSLGGSNKGYGLGSGINPAFSLGKEKPKQKKKKGKTIIIRL